MELVCNSIVLIGFKNTGKSVVGESLARKLNIWFLDLDKHIEFLYQTKFDELLTCKQIVQKRGEVFFRDLEMAALSEVIAIKPAVISLGGGAPVRVENQEMIKSGVVVQITAPKEIVLSRIRMNGLPGFNAEDDLLESFNRMWDDRNPLYEKIKHFSIENNGTVDEAVHRFIEKLRENELIR